MTAKPSIDVAALVELFAQASAKRAEALRQATESVSLEALHGRELTLKTIGDALKAVTHAASAGAARNTTGVDPDVLLSKAVEGMDAAVRQAVEANRRALEQFVNQGLAVDDKEFRKALGDLEKMEGAMVEAIDKAVASAAEHELRGPWAESLAALRQHGSATGTAAADAVKELTSRARQMASDGVALQRGMTHQFLNQYAALASGVLLGMSDALSSPRQAAAAKRRSGAR